LLTALKNVVSAAEEVAGRLGVSVPSLALGAPLLPRPPRYSVCGLACGSGQRAALTQRSAWSSKMWRGVPVRSMPVGSPFSQRSNHRSSTL
jgi:hypothetical protein